MIRGIGARLAREAKRRLLLARARLWIAIHPRRAEAIRRERAWIFGGAVGRVFSDNGAALFAHVRRVRPDIAAFWAINGDSPDIDVARAVGPVLLREQLVTMVRTLLAAVHVISHGIHDVPGCASPASRDAVKVRLGHGLTALKRTKPRLGHDNRSSNALFDLVPVASEFEKAHKLEWEIAPERMVVTGLARFDTLLARQREVATDCRRIVYLPTWRDADDPKPVESAIRDFLAAPGLHALLESRDACLEVFLHINFGPAVREAVAALGTGRIVFAALADPQPLFAAAGLLITDYSSVAWDMLYLDKPVLFYQFDRQRFEADRGGYLEPDRLPGPLATDAAGLIARIDEYLSGDWRRKGDWPARMAAAQRMAFAFRDERNCERIVAAIEERLSQRRQAADGAA